ncbi:MAG TPA: hypothetical protein VLW53_17520 [Candidatus Eisenbacteria bacterium]|nr:hypothetical protein [Candidatus Eisenbacteria bacterium]
MAWVAGSLLVAAAAVAVRWWFRRVDSLGRRREFPLVAVLVLAALGAGLLVPVVRTARLEGRLSRVASDLVGAPVTVHCQGLGQEFVDVGDELGYVRLRPDGRPERAALLKRAQCGDLAGYLHSDRRHPTAAQVLAVHVLSHEAMHMAGSIGEAETECRAVQVDARTARLLGAPPADARALARSYWQTDYPRMPDAYLSEQCRAGGRLDEHLPDAPWVP